MPTKWHSLEEVVGLICPWHLLPVSWWLALLHVLHGYYYG